MESLHRTNAEDDAPVLQITVAHPQQQQQQLQPQRPIPISQRAKSNVETKAAARRGLLNIMMNKFSSTPVQEIDDNSTLSNERLISIRKHMKNDSCGTNASNPIDLFQYDASLTKSEREYLKQIILMGDTNSIQSASVVLQNEDVFPTIEQQQQILAAAESNSSSREEAGSTCKDHNVDSCIDELSVLENDDDGLTTATSTMDDSYSDEKKHDGSFRENNASMMPLPGLSSSADIGNTTGCGTSHRDSIIQQQLFRLHETNSKRDLMKLCTTNINNNETVHQVLSRQNSILTMDDSTNTGTSLHRQYRSISPTQSPAPIIEGEVEPEPLLATNGDENNNADLEFRQNLLSMMSEATTLSNFGSVMNQSEQVPSPAQQNATTTTTPNAIEVCSSIHHSQVGWNPFDDISSWLDGSQGVEVTASKNNVPESMKLDDNTFSLTDAKASMYYSQVQQNPFRILGTSADDVSCHPHVLSPPLMESILAFVPEYHLNNLYSSHHRQYPSPSQIHQAAHCPPLPDNADEIETSCENKSLQVHQVPNDDSTNTNLDCRQLTCHLDTTLTVAEKISNETAPTSVEQSQNIEPTKQKISLTNQLIQSPPQMSYNFWLKYSLVRDGPGLWTFLRQVRASALCVLAIETTEGHVFGAYTSQPWRLSKGWYGNKDTFLWKMRRSRLETAGKTLMQQICQESEIQVYPYRAGNVAVQYCSKKCLMLGQGEVIPSPKKHDPEKPRPSNVGKHYGYAIYLDKDLTCGTTSSSETFGNPCLLDATKRGAKFTVANIELWTLTPHTNVADAEQTELSNLFLDGGRDSAHRLNFLNILVGGPI